MEDIMTAGMYERQYLEQLYHQLYQAMMDKDEAVKKNRLSLLCIVKDLVNCVGDLSKIVM